LIDGVLSRSSSGVVPSAVKRLIGLELKKLPTESVIIELSEFHGYSSRPGFDLSSGRHILVILGEPGSALVGSGDRAETFENSAASSTTITAGCLNNEGADNCGNKAA